MIGGGRGAALLRLCLLVLLVIPFVTGCRTDDGRERVRIWHQKIGGERAFFERIIQEYNAAHPDVEIEVLYRETEELRNLFVVASVGGQGPDLVFGPSDNVAVFAITESIQPVTNLLPPEYLEQFSEDGLIAWKDETWMVADQVGNHLMFVHNAALMPEPPEDTDAMIRQLQEASQAGAGRRTDVYGLTWNYTEPFFFIPFLSGYGGRVMDDEGNPTLDTEETVKAIQFILDLRDRYRVIPRESDYNIAETLFKDQKAASIINGPWAWAGYGTAGVDYRLARIPKMSETGLWCAPFISSKGYSVNINVTEERYPVIREVLEYLTNSYMQVRMAEELATIPVIVSVRESAAVQENPILQASLRQVEVGVPMPVEPQLRQVWDGMRGPYQLIMNGAVSAREGARMMQREVEKRIADTFL
jgi:maltose-binding protein MalE